MVTKKISQEELADQLIRQRRIEAFREQNIAQLRVNVQDEDYRQAAAKFFLKMIDKWGLNEKEAANLLDVPHRLVTKWRQSDTVEMDEYVFERISYLTGIYKLLCLVYEGHEVLVLRWMKTPRDTMGFDGESPLVALTQGGVETFAMTRLHLEQILEYRHREDPLE